MKNNKTLFCYDWVKVFEAETDTKDTPLLIQSHKNIFWDIITLVSTFEHGHTLSKSDEKINWLYINWKKLDNFYKFTYWNHELREFYFRFEKQKKLFLTEKEKQNIKKVMKEKPDKITIEKVEKLLENYEDIYDLEWRRLKEFLVLAYAYLEYFR